MKKVLFVFVAALALVSCSDRQVPMVEWTFQASYSTKAAVDAGSGAFSWGAGDKIAVWNETSSSFVQFTTIAGKGKFSAIAPADAHFSTAAFYPAGVAITTGSISLPSSYASPRESASGFVMKADIPADGNFLLFKHLGAVIMLNFTHMASGMDRVTVSSPSVSLSGDFTIDAGAVRAVSGTNAVTVFFEPVKDQDLSVSIPVPTGSYPLRISVGSELKPDFATFETDGTLTFGRAQLYSFSTIDFLARGLVIPTGDAFETYELEDDDINWE